MARPNAGARGRAYLSWALLGLSAALFVAVAVLWYRDRESEPELPPPPTSIPGQNQAIHVKSALEAQGLSSTFAPGGGRSPELSVAGQLLDVEGAKLFAFIYPEGPDQLADDTAELDLTEVTVVTTRGTPAAPGTPRVFAGSNVIAVLYGGSEEMAEKVRTAIEGLP